MLDVVDTGKCGRSTNVETDYNVALGRLVDGELTFDDATKLLRPHEPAAAAFALQLAQRADAAQAAALVHALQSAVEATPAIQYGVGTELVRRGHWTAVLQYDWVGSLIVEFAIAATEAPTLPDRDAFFAKATTRLAAALADPDTNPLSILGAKRFIGELEPGFADELLTWLAAEVEAEHAEGFYDDLEYTHGQVDPMVELARCFVAAGRFDDGLRYLEQRDSTSPQMMHIEELRDLAEIWHVLPPNLQQTWWPRLRRWAADAPIAPEQVVSLETEWLRHTGDGNT